MLRRCQDAITFFQFFLARPRYKPLFSIHPFSCQSYSSNSLSWVIIEASIRRIATPFVKHHTTSFHVLGTAQAPELPPQLVEYRHDLAITKFRFLHYKPHRLKTQGKIKHSIVPPKNKFCWKITILPTTWKKIFGGLSITTITSAIMNHWIIQH